MAKIIDLDFYRKFRIILPIQPGMSTKNQSTKVARTPTKRYRRRQKDETKSKITKKE